MTTLGVISTDTWHSLSWFLNDPLGDSTARMIALALWGVTFVGFMLAGLGAFGWSPVQGSWRTITVVASVLSLIALALFWNAFAVLVPNKVGSNVVNIGALVAILILSFPSTEIIE